MQELIPPFVAFAVTTAAVYVILESMTRRSRDMQRRVDAVMTDGASMISQAPNGGSQADVDSMSLTLLRKDNRPDLVPWLTAWLSTSDLGKNLRLSMIRAGVPLRPTEFLLLTLVSTFFFAMVGALLTHQSVMALLMAIIGFIIPVAWLSSRQALRRSKFDAQLPDAITLITSSLRSGYSFFEPCRWWTRRCLSLSPKSLAGPSWKLRWAYQPKLCCSAWWPA